MFRRRTSENQSPRLCAITRAAACTLVLAAVALAAAGCGRTGPPPVKAAASGGGPRFVVVAAEDFWGNLAAQLAGDRASVSSIVVNPSADPHSYEPSTADARRMSGAN